MEEWFVHLMRIELMVELLIVLIGEVGWLACPCWVHIIDDILLAGLYLLAVLPLFLHTKGNLHREELAVLSEQTLYGCILEILYILLVDVQHDVRTALCLDGLLHGVFRRAVA